MLTFSLVTLLATLAGLGVAALPWTELELEGSVQACRALGEGARQIGASQWAGEPAIAPSVEGIVAR